MDVGKRGQELGVEPRRAVVPLPARAGARHLVDAVLGQRRDQPRQVAVVLGDRVPLPELADLLILGRVDRPPQQLEDPLARHGSPFGRGDAIARRWSRGSASAAAKRTPSGIASRPRGGSPRLAGRRGAGPAAIVVPRSPLRSAQLPDALARVAGVVWRPRSTRVCRPPGLGSAAPARPRPSRERTAPRGRGRAWRRSATWRTRVRMMHEHVFAVKDASASLAGRRASCCDRRSPPR